MTATELFFYYLRLIHEDEERRIGAIDYRVSIVAAMSEEEVLDVHRRLEVSDKQDDRVLVGRVRYDLSHFPYCGLHHGKGLRLSLIGKKSGLVHEGFVSYTFRSFLRGMNVMHNSCILCDLYPYLSSKLKAKIIRAFLGSGKLTVRDKGYALVNATNYRSYIYKVQSNYEMSGDKNALPLIVEYSNVKYLLKSYKSMICESIDNKGVLYARLKKAGIDVTELLKKADLACYLHLIAVNSKQYDSQYFIPDRELEESLFGLEKEKRAPLNTWCVGVLGKVDLLKELIDARW